MKILWNPTLPGFEPSAVQARISLSVDSSGRWHVGVEAIDLVTREPIALGASSGRTADEALAEAQDLVRQCWRVLPTLVDAPPFP